jgi:hypothetical protein
MEIQLKYLCGDGEGDDTSFISGRTSRLEEFVLVCVSE